MPKKPKNMTDAELAVLSLLVEKPMHGYQIEQTIVDRGMREWTSIGFSSIYYILEKFKSFGWLESSISISDGKGPAKQIFTLTTKGERIWKKAILNSLAHPSRHTSNFQIGLSNLNQLDKEQIISALTIYQNDLSEKILELSAKQQFQNPHLPWNVSAMFDLSLAQIKTELEWLNNFMDDVRTRNFI